MTSASNRIEAETRFGRYQVHELIARGGMGEVWLATAHGPNGFRKRVVLKTVLPNLAEMPAYIDMLVNEASLAAKLDHPNIVHVFELGCADGMYFIAMEYLPGRTLGQAVSRASKRGNRLPVGLALAVIASCCDGLQYAHDYVDEDGEPVEVLHRDISPSNVMLSFAGRVTILDFGIATLNDNDGLTRSGTLKGKYHYMPPERICGKPADRRSDIYALGVVLYQLATWSRPYEAKSDYELLRAIVQNPVSSLRERAPWVSQRLEEIVLTAMAHSPEDRFPDAASFARALRGYARELGEPVEPADIGAYLGYLFPEAKELARGRRPRATGTPGSRATEPSLDERISDGSSAHQTIPVTEDSVEVIECAPEPPSNPFAPARPPAPPRRAARGSTGSELSGASASVSPSPFDAVTPVKDERSSSGSDPGDLFTRSEPREGGTDVFEGYGTRVRKRSESWPFARSADGPSWWRRMATKDEGR